jgi:ubiquitin carboxyl-terminal hydrolase 5/13
VCVVKLGTITPHGADVFSYADDENDLVQDPKLAEHLRNWGINVMEMIKTDKTMAELQINLNKSWEFSKITESGSCFLQSTSAFEVQKVQPLILYFFYIFRLLLSGKQLVALKGPGHIGLVNLGNSCYVNSVLQCLCALPETKQRYLTRAQQLFETAPDLPAQDAPTQVRDHVHAR